jgi:hypothetical protein
VRDQLLNRHREANQTAWSPAVRALLSRHGLEPAAIPRRAARLTRRDVEAFLAARPPARFAAPLPASRAVAPAPLGGPGGARPAEPPLLCTTSVDVTAIGERDLPIALIAALVEVGRGRELLRAGLAPSGRLLVELVGTGTGTGTGTRAGAGDGIGRRYVITGAGDLSLAGIRRHLAGPAFGGPAAAAAADLHLLVSDVPRVLPSPASSPAAVALALTAGSPSVEALPGAGGSAQLAIRSMGDLALGIRSGSWADALCCAAALRALFARATWKETLL